MPNSIIKILMNPDAFFQAITGEHENLKRPALIVLISALVGAAAAFLIVGPTVKLMSGMIAGMDTIIILAAVIATLVITVISWLVYAGIFFILFICFNQSESYLCIK